MNTKEFEEWEALIAKVARNVGGDYPEAEIPDLEQHLWVVLLERQSAGKLVDVNHQHTKTALKFAATEQCLRWRSQAYVLSPQYAYRVSTVRMLFETHFEHILWETSETNEEMEDPTDRFAFQSDLSYAYSKLSKGHKEIILRRYGLKESLDDSERKQLSRALDRTCQILNTYRPVTRDKKRPPDS